jgi:hypothetical protein
MKEHVQTEAAIRGRQVSRLVAAVSLVALMGGVPAHADRDDDRGRQGAISAQEQVEDLAVCYARGTDAIGSAVDAEITAADDLQSTVNLDDPQFALGLSLYRQCFSKHFSFTLAFDGVPVLTVPAAVTSDTDAPLQWANFVNNAFRGPGYVNTQHHMGSISSSIHGRTAEMVSYLIATHAYGPSSALTGVQVVGGTYTDEVVKERGRWVIRNRTLNITSSVNVPAS